VVFPIAREVVVDRFDQRAGESREDYVGPHDAVSGLDALFGDGADVLAARLFAQVFTPGARSPQSFKDVRKLLAAMGGVNQRRRFLTVDAMGEPTYAAALEVALLWEHAYLAARIPSGDQGLFIVLLRAGRRAQLSADPYAAALAALRATGRG
jgi:hypothetical protein